MSIFVNRFRILFVHIPKTGGSSISRWLRDRGGEYSDGFIHTSLQQTKHDLSALWSFCVVRNPWDRMVSLYHYVCKVNPDFQNVDFHGWLQTGVSYQKHWYSVSTPQLDWIQTKPNCIMRFESLNKEFEVVQSFFDDYTPLPKINSTQHSPYQDYYNDWSKKLVADMFYKDIKEFNYKF
jgi:hypothetical protein